MTSPRRIVASLLAILALGTIAIGASACGYESHSTDVVEGEPVKLEGIQYNVVLSRFLNPEDTEDSAYLDGQTPSSGKSYFGVFMEVQNENKSAKTLPFAFSLTDASGQSFESIPGPNFYAFPFEGEIEAEEQIPAPDSPPQQGPIGGVLVLFMLPDTVSANRPLTMQIIAPKGGEAEVTLDL